ncbi:hypothetical protein E2C01_008280 [Portunus trituberculatus]|uniref:Uncharacterized protein n=1 Tax=Portunus trituberculatus TaxID=210409 RepID=A0A5B7D0D6_PORTR|nr:hypothetical protein [Portunus trituberculatus]
MSCRHPLPANTPLRLQKHHQQNTTSNRHTHANTTTTKNTYTNNDIKTATPPTLLSIPLCAFLTSCLASLHLPRLTSPRSVMSLCIPGVTHPAEPHGLTET